MVKINHEPQLTDKVHIELITQLYELSAYRTFLNFIPGIVFFLVIKDQVEGYFPVTWLICLIIVSIARFIDIKTIQAKKNTIDNYKKARRHFAIGAGLLGIIYGGGTVICFEQLPNLYQLALISLIVTLPPSGMVFFLADKLSFNLFFLLLLVPITIQNFIIGDRFHLYLAICGVIYIVIIRFLFSLNHNNLKESVYLKLVNMELVESLSESNKNLEQLSTIDELTQIANRRQFDWTLTKELSRAKRTNLPLSLIMVDIDHFKQYNDTYGHIKGDECLQLIAKTIQEKTQRPGDLVARYGGEEICIILPETNIDGALNFANTIHTAISDLKIEHAKSKNNPYVTLSMGIATFNTENDISEKDLITEADKALYEAKGAGRNKICVAKINNC